MKALAIAAVNIRRMLRDRSNIFFVFVFPMLLILVLGVSFGRGFEPRIGVVATDPGSLGDDLVRQLERMPDVEVEPYTSLEDLRTSVERGQLEAGVVVPVGYDEAIRAGRDAEVRYVARQSELGLQLSQTVRSAVAEQGQVLRAARLFVSEQEGPSTRGSRGPGSRRRRSRRSRSSRRRSARSSSRRRSDASTWARARCCCSSSSSRR